MKKILKVIESIKAIVFFIAICLLIIGWITNAGSLAGIGGGTILALLFGRWVSYFLLAYAAFAFLDTGYRGQVAWDDITGILALAAVLWFVGLSGEEYDENALAKIHTNDRTHQKNRHRRRHKFYFPKKEKWGCLSRFTVFAIIVLSYYFLN